MLGLHARIRAGTGCRDPALQAGPGDRSGDALGGPSVEVLARQGSPRLVPSMDVLGIPGNYNELLGTPRS